MNPPFHLDQAISRWRAELNASGSIGSADLAELETHLRDSFEELRTHALADDEAFHIARRRLGGEEVVEEFVKVAPDAVWAGRARWMILGVLVSQIVWSGTRIAMILAHTLIVTSTRSFSWRDPAVAWGHGLLSLLTMGLFAYLLVRLVRGKWRLGNSKPVVFLRHPAVLAVMACLLGFLPGIAANLSIRLLGQEVFLYQIRLQVYAGQAVSLLTPVLLAAALTMAQRRVRQVS